VSDPTGAFEARQEADPEMRAAVVHNTVEPLVKATVPVGAAPGAVTVAE
jgi:hypothetical protein